MRIKGKRRGLAAERVGALKGSTDDGAMSAMHAVEIADRHQGPPQRSDVDARFAVAQNIKRFRRHVAHQARFRDVVTTGRLLISLYQASSELNTVNVRLINFQINRMFNADRLFPPIWWRRSGAKRHGCRCDDSDPDR